MLVQRLDLVPKCAVHTKNGTPNHATTHSCGSPIKGVDKVEENLDNGDQNKLGRPMGRN
jgi:hypothetical protein